MATYRDYIPRKDADFDHWAKNFVDMVVKLTRGLIPVWTHIPTLRVTDLISAYHDWHAAYEATLVPHTPAVTMKKNEERAKTEHIYRTFKDHYLDFDEVTDAQRRDLGLHLRDTHYSPFGKPKTVPLIGKLEAIGGCRFRLYFKDEKSERSRAIPPGCNGCLLKYLLSEEPIEDKELLTFPPLTHHFSCIILDAFPFMPSGY